MKIVRSPSRFLCEVCSSSRSTNQLIYPFYCFKGSFDRFELTFRTFEDVFHCSVIKVRSIFSGAVPASAATRLVYHKHLRLSRTFFIFLIFFSKSLLPWKDLCPQRTFISYHKFLCLSTTFFKILTFAVTVHPAERLRHPAIENRFTMGRMPAQKYAAMTVSPTAQLSYHLSFCLSTINFINFHVFMNI